VRLRTLLVVAALSLVALGAALAIAREGDTRAAAPIDEARGTYRGVRVGDSAASVRRLLGEPVSREDGFAPAGQSPAEVGVPESIPAPGTYRLLKYDDVAFLASPAGVYAFIVTQGGAGTTRGVAIGDRMVEARDAYRTRCKDVAGGESLLGGQEFYPSCGARVGPHYVWFGRDPIRSITIVATRGR
jgi:hypothetical protein